MMKMKFLCKCADKWQLCAPLILRLSVGAIFLVHGWLKWSGGVDGLGDFFGSLGIPAAGFFAMFVTLLELGGGLFLILGLFVHWLGKLFTIEMLVALFLVHFENGFLVSNGGYEFVLLLLAASISLMITGGGKWSLDNKLFSGSKK